MHADSRWDVGHFWDLDHRRHGTELVLPSGDWNKTAEVLTLNFAESGHPVFRATSALERKERGKKSIHFNGSEETIELILRTSISVNQLSVCVAVADLCRELSKDSRARGKPDTNEYLETVEIPTELLVAPHTDAELQGNLLQDYGRKFEQLPEEQKLSKLCSDASLKIVETGQFFITLDEEEGLDEMKNLCPEYTLPLSEEASRVKRWILANTKIGLVLDVKVCFHQGRYGIEVMIESLFRDRTVSWVRIVNGIMS